MPDPRSEAITAIRTRLATITGLWPVAYSGKPCTQTGVAYLEEEIILGAEDDAEIPQVGQPRLREGREAYQMTLRMPIGDDIRIATEQAGLIARAFLDNSDPVVTDSGVPLWFSGYRLNSRGSDSGWQRFVLVLTYTYIYTA